MFAVNKKLKKLWIDSLEMTAKLECRPIFIPIHSIFVCKLYNIIHIELSRCASKLNLKHLNKYLVSVDSNNKQIASTEINSKFISCHSNIIDDIGMTSALYSMTTMCHVYLNGTAMSNEFIIKIEHKRADIIIH